MAEQLRLGFDRVDPIEVVSDDGRWDYRRGMPERSGLAAYTHLLRWHGDPPETKARGAEARAEGGRLPGASKRAGGTVDLTIAWACEEGAVFWTLSRFIEWDDGRAAA